MVGLRLYINQSSLFQSAKTVNRERSGTNRSLNQRGGRGDKIIKCLKREKGVLKSKTLISSQTAPGSLKLFILTKPTEGMQCGKGLKGGKGIVIIK